MVPQHFTFEKNKNFFFKKFAAKSFCLIFALPSKKGTQKSVDSVAQLVEQYTFNVWALGSSPSGITKSKRKPLIIKGFLVLKQFGVNIG